MFSSTASSPSTPIPTLAELANHIRGRDNWLVHLQERRDSNTLPTKVSGQFDAVFFQVREELGRGRCAFPLAVCRVGLFCKPARFLTVLRRRGLFRCSKVGFQSKGVSALAQILQEDAVALGIEPADIEYLKSVGTLTQLAPFASVQRRMILEAVSKSRPFSLIKSCLVVVDRAFRPNVDDPSPATQRLAAAAGDPAFTSPEEKAIGFSMLLALVVEAGLVAESELAMVDEEAVLDGTCENVLVAANTLYELAQAEELLDNFAYQCIVANKRRNEIHVQAFDPAFEKSIRLGYVNMMMQKVIVHKVTDERYSAHQSLKVLAKRMSVEFGHKVVHREANPLDRFVKRMPVGPPIRALVQEDAHYREEVEHLNMLAKESYGVGPPLWHAEVIKGLRVQDVLKLVRLYTVVSEILFNTMDRCNENFDQRNRLDMRSRLPVYREDQIVTFLNAFFEPGTTALLLDVLVFDASKPAFFDLQYRPFVKIGNHYIVAVGVLVASDLIRNVLYEQSARLLVGKGDDPMQMRVAAVLKHLGFLVHCNMPYTTPERAKGEIDILAYKDGVLLVWECKNTFHPCSPHEMRSTWEQMSKAGSQLTKAAAWLERAGAVEQVFKKLGWDVGPPVRIRTCIVSAVRIFSGYQAEGHPIRQAAELINVLATGKMSVSTGEEYRFWKQEHFSVDDLHAYLDGTLVSTDLFDAMIPAGAKYPLADKAWLCFPSFALDVERLHALIKRPIYGAVMRVRARYQPPVAVLLIQQSRKFLVGEVVGKETAEGIRRIAQNEATVHRATVPRSEACVLSNSWRPFCADPHVST